MSVERRVPRHALVLVLAGTGQLQERQRMTSLVSPCATSGAGGASVSAITPIELGWSFHLGLPLIGPVGSSIPNCDGAVGALADQAPRMRDLCRQMDRMSLSIGMPGIADTCDAIAAALVVATTAEEASARLGSVRISDHGGRRRVAEEPL